MSRWIRIDTGIFEHAAFAQEQFSEREAWVWMISRAAWKDTKHKVGNTIMPVKAGSFFTTIREMQSAWRWRSTAKVVGFLKRLQRDGMATQETDKSKTLVTICNYCEYQGIEDSAKTAKRQAEDSEKTQKTPINQDTTSSLRSEENKRATRLPESWVLPTSWGKWAVDEGYDEQTIRLQAVVFRDYWCSKAGVDATKKDWLGTWRNWMRKQPKRISLRHAQHSPPRNATMERQEAALRAFTGQSGYDDDDEFTGNTIDLRAADSYAH